MVSRQEAVNKIKKMVKENRAAMLVTHNVEGGLVSRPMTTQEQEFDGDLWFFVSRDSDVVKEIYANPEVNVAYSRDGDYVSISGQGIIVKDVDKKKELWYEELKYWFEGKGPESPEVVLIKVAADSARYWESGGDGFVGETINAIKAMISGDSPIESSTVNY